MAGHPLPVPTSSPAARRRPGGALAIVAFLVVTAIVAYRVVTHLNVPGHPEVPRWALQDFRDAVYYPVVAFLQGHNPYDPADMLRRYPIGLPFPWYLPMTLVIHMPLGLLPYETAEFAYFALMVAVMLGVAWLTLRLCDLEGGLAEVFGLGTLVVMSRPGHWNLFTGQCTPLAVLGVYVALRFVDERPGLAALGVALAEFKPTFGVPLAVLLLARGSLRPVVIGTAVAGVVSLVPALVLASSAGGPRALLGSLAAARHAFDADAAVNPTSSPSRVDVASLLGRLLGRPPGSAAEIGIAIAVLGLGALGVGNLSRRADGGSRRLSASLVCLVILGCTYHQAYDLLLLVLPLAVLITRGDEMPWASHPWTRWTLVALMAIPMANYLTSDTAISFLGLAGRWWVVLASVNGVLLLASLLIIVRLALQAPAGWQASRPRRRATSRGERRA